MTDKAISVPDSKERVALELMSFIASQMPARRDAHHDGLIR